MRAPTQLLATCVGGVVLLRLGAVLERTRPTRRTTPTRQGPFPAVVPAHGYLDPQYYVRGQGMTASVRTSLPGATSRCIWTTATARSRTTTRTTRTGCDWATAPT